MKKVALLILLMAAPAAAVPPTYELRCRGSIPGRPMRVELVNGQRAGYDRLIVSFRFSDRPAPQGLAPGQCSWIDRGMRPGEPIRLEEDILQGQSSAANYLTSPAHYWTFYGYNTNRGFLQVTRSHYGKPMRFD